MDCRTFRLWPILVACALLLVGGAVLVGCGTSESDNPGSWTWQGDGSTQTGGTTGGTGGTGGAGGTTTLPTLTLASPQPATVASGATSTLTATVLDTSGATTNSATVTATTTRGTLGSWSSIGSGQYQATFTGSLAGSATITVRAQVGGASASSVSTTITVTAGTATQLTLTPSVNSISPDGVEATTLTVSVEDAVGNPVSGTVDLTATSGTVTPSAVTLSGGTGTATFTSTTQALATITATLQGSSPPLANSVDINVVDTGVGEPALVNVSVTPSTLSVAGVGGTERGTITVIVQDRFGTAVPDVPNNVEVELVDRPNGGENLGTDPGSGLPLTQATLSTSAGTATTTLNSGTLPGSVRVEVRVVKDKNGSVLSPPLSATVPQIAILAGPPFSVLLSRSNKITDNHDGTLTHEYLAIVSDQYGNAVPDGTSVFFGQIINAKVVGADGAITTASPTTFTSVANFSDGGVLKGDTLVVLSGTGAGGFTVSSDPAGTTLDLDQSIPVASNETELGFAVGDNQGGGVLQSAGLTADGVARSPNTYPGTLANSIVYLYAETGGRTVSDSGVFGLSWVAPTQMEIAGPSKVGTGQSVNYQVRITDSSTPTAYPVPNLGVSVAITGGSPNSVTGTTDSNGTVSFAWTTPAGAGTHEINALAVDGTTATLSITVQ